MTNVHRLPLNSNAQLPTRDARGWVTCVELCDEVDITYRQADYWTRTRLLHPLEDGYTPGSGRLRCYPDTQVQRAAAINALLQAGVSLSTCRRVIDEFTATGHVQVGDITITLNPAGATA